MGTMNISEQIIEQLRQLPPGQQKEVLDFVESLREKNGVGSRHTLRGLWKDLDVRVTEEEITEARREMWSKFPRDFS